MTWQQFESNWQQIAETAKARWGDLTPHELRAIAGKRDRLVGRLRVHYGLSRRDAEREADEFAASLSRLVPHSRSEHRPSRKPTSPSLPHGSDSSRPAIAPSKRPTAA